MKNTSLRRIRLFICHRKKLRDSKFGNELVIYWYNIGKAMKTPTLDKEIHFPTLASQKIKIQGWNVIFVLSMLVTYVIVQHRKSKIPRLEGHILDYQVWSSMYIKLQHGSHKNLRLEGHMLCYQVW